MKIFFDCEMTGLHKDTTLISIGMIAENGKTFYAEFEDYNQSQVDEWIELNVLGRCLFLNKYNKNKIQPSYNLDNVCMVGTKKEVSNILKEWLNQFDKVQLVSDVCHYDMVLFTDLFGSAFDLPANISAYCHDINQDIAKFYNIDSYSAFDKYREEIIKIDTSKNNKHNALYDAKVIKAIYEKTNATKIN